MFRRIDLTELRFRLTRPENPANVRAMALICFAAAALLLFGLLANADNLPVRKESRALTTAVTASAGVLYWILAPRFRAWMLHVIILIGLGWGCIGLTLMDSSIGSALTILSILWTCLLIGTIYKPPVARAYGVLVLLGIAYALSSTPVDAAESMLVGLSFGLTIIVTMEILSRTSSRLREEATHDPLTGLLNRKGLEEAVYRTERLSLRNREPTALVHIDLDAFKTVNDSEGHLAGDRVLVRCAEVWSAGIRPQDVLARAGGDEFVLLVAGADVEQAEHTLRRLTDVSPASFTYGIAVAAPGESIEAKMVDADSRLIEAKKSRTKFAPMIASPTTMP